MSNSKKLEAVKEAWLSLTESVPQEAVDLEVRLSALTARLLANGQPVSAGQLAESWGFPVEQVEQILEQAEGKTIQMDEAGRLIGAAGLSILPSPHKFLVNGKALYAWCSFDAMFLPGFLGRTAEVISTDPISGAEVRLTVGPQGVESVIPEEVVLAIAIPGVSYSDEILRAGPSSEVCSQMHFFASPETAEEWLERHPGMLVLTAQEAFEAAATNWLARLPDELRPASLS